MLEKPHNGYSQIHLFELDMTINCLCCGPYDWLLACKNGLDHHMPAELSFATEFENALIIADEHSIRISYEDGEDDHLITVSEKYNLMNLTEELVMDINRDFDSWIKEWVSLFYPGPEEQLKTILRETESSWLRRKWKEKKKTVNKLLMM